MTAVAVVLLLGTRTAKGRLCMVQGWCGTKECTNKDCSDKGLLR